MACSPRFAPLLRLLVLGTGVFPLLQACGGRSDTEDYLFDANGNINVGASQSSSGTRNTGGSSASGNGPGTSGRGGAVGTAGSGIGESGTGVGGTGIAGAGAMGGSIGVSGRGGTGAGGRGGTGAGATGAGGTLGTAGAGGKVGTAGTAGVAGAAGSPPGPPITCGAQTCDSDTQTCCASLGGTNCIANNKACNGAVLSCTTNADCPGQICCLSLTGVSDTASSCKDRCDGMGPVRDRQLCEVNQDCRPPTRFCTATVFGINVCTRNP